MSEAITQPVAAPAPAPAPAPSPNYTPPPAPMPAATPIMEDGGETKRSGSSFREFFSDINVMDVAISAFIVGGVLYAVHYYKFVMMLEKTGYADLSTRVQKLESAVEAAKRKAEANANGSQNNRRGRRALI